VVTLSDEGVIVDISTPPSLDREPGMEFFPGVLVPGFLNAHCHLELSHLRGAIAPGGGFAGFARGMRVARAGGEERAENLERHDEEQNPVSERDSQSNFWDAKMWSEGVSAVNDVCNGSTTFDMKTRSRVKYHNFCELFGLRADYARAFALRDEAWGMGLTASVTPHSTYSLNRAAFAFAAAADGAESAAGDDPGCPLSIHFLESEEEIDLFRRKGPLWDWYSEQGLSPDFLDYGSPAERLVAQVPHDRPVMLVHNCCVTQRDIDMVMGHFTAPVTWVLCPGSNRYISGMTPPVGLLRKNGLKIAIGTDSLASNETLSMVREMQLLGEAGGVTLAELLAWAAADTIEVGNAPGLVLLTGVDLTEMTLTDSSKTQRII
jgi:cytosine/adenosine deaminase-related metal-dependent hydrolase